MPCPPPDRPPFVPRRLLRRACAAAALLLAGGGASAQSLVEIYELARAYDATYLAVRRQVESVPYAAAQADALRRPSVGLLGTASRADTYTPIGVTTTHATAGEVALSGRQPLYNRTNDATIGQAQKSLESAGAALDSAEQDLIVRVAQAYFDVLASIDTLNTTRAAKAAIAEQLASAKRNFEVGTATITDTREAQAQYDLALAQEIQADNALRTARVALDQLVGRVNVEPRPLRTPVVLPPVLPADVETWVGTADGEHPSIRNARLALDIARLEVDKARAGHLPTLDAVAQLSWQRARSNNLQIDGVTRGSSIGLELNVPVFSGYAVDNRVKETLVLEEKSQNDLEAARRGVAQSTRQVFLGVQSGRAQVGALEAAEVSSKLSLEATQVGYRVGVRVNVDVLNAQTQLFTTQRDLARARYDVIVNGLRLRQAAGVLNGGDLTAANELLAR